MEAVNVPRRPLVDLFLLSAILGTCWGSLYNPWRTDMMRRHGDEMEDDPDEPDPNFFYIHAFMPGVIPQTSDQYICASFAVPRGDSYIIGFEPYANMYTAHHMLLYGCSDVATELGRSFDCSGMSTCSKKKILFAWARNATQPSLPRGVGFHVGGNSEIYYVTIQIHYGDITHLKERDHSGLSLYMTYNPQPYAGGIYLLGSAHLSIPPSVENFHADIACEYTNPMSIHPFAFRTHAHGLSTVITGYRIRHGDWVTLGKGNPQWAQAFYPMDRTYEIREGDVLAARCTFNSKSRDTTTHAGMSSEDEMCNFYMMYYTDALQGETYQMCWNVGSPQLFQYIPPGFDTPPKNPPSMIRGVNRVEPAPYEPAPALYGYDNDNDNDDYNWYVRNEGDQDDETNYNNLLDKILGSYGNAGEEVVAEDEDSGEGNTTTLKPLVGKTSEEAGTPTEKTKTEESDAGVDKEDSSEDLTVVDDWPAEDHVTLGQVAGVAVDSAGDVHIFHRADRVWGFGVFGADNRFLDTDKGRITNNTVLVLDKDTGHVKRQWGANMFFMPHGLSIDHQDNVWLTDVALNQIFKFPPGGGDTPLLSLGTELEPGSDKDHFCKPADVAVDPQTGDVFVADGYCNSRIVKFSATGDYIMEWGKASSYVGKELSINPEPSTFSIPHSLAFVPDRRQLCVADRQNGRIQCFEAGSGAYVRQYQLEEFGELLFAISYSPWKGGVLYAVNGQGSSRSGAEKPAVLGFTLDFNSGKLLQTWGPTNSEFSRPHDVAASPDYRNVYVVEIGPNRVWQLERQLGPDQSGYGLTDDRRQPRLEETPQHIPNAATDASLTTTAIIVAVLAVPIFLMLLVAVFVRLRAQGRMRFFRGGDMGTAIRSGYKATDKFSLGNFFNRRKGFNQVNTEDSDHDGGMGWSDDSDVEEYSILNSKRTQNL